MSRPRMTISGANLVPQRNRQPRAAARSKPGHAAAGGELPRSQRLGGRRGLAHFRQRPNTLADAAGLGPRRTGPGPAGPGSGLLALVLLALVLLALVLAVLALVLLALVLATGWPLALVLLALVLLALVLAVLALVLLALVSGPAGPGPACSRLPSRRTSLPLPLACRTRSP